MGFPSKQAVVFLVLAGLALNVACAGSSGVATEQATADPLQGASQAVAATLVQPAAGNGERLLLSGGFDLPSAGAFGEPGFHQILIANGILPQQLGPTEGRRLLPRPNFRRIRAWPYLECRQKRS